jgi:hypothetical protein
MIFAKKKVNRWKSLFYKYFYICPNKRTW